MKVISLQLLINAANRGHIALPGELAGYAILLLLEQLTEQTVEATLSEVHLLEDGKVRFYPTEGEFGVTPRLVPRQLLGRLLEVSSSVSPGLRRVSRGAATGSAGLVRELETALIPLNRNAARRGLARLHREVCRLLASGHLIERPTLGECSNQESANSQPRAQRVEALEVLVEPPVRKSTVPELEALEVLVEPLVRKSTVPELEALEVLVEPLVRKSTVEVVAPSSLSLPLDTASNPKHFVAMGIPDLELPNRSVVSVETNVSAEPRSITLVIAEVAPIVEVSASAEPRSTTLVIAEVAPIVEVSAPAEPRSTTLVIAEVAPIAPMATSSDVAEPRSVIGASSMNAVEPETTHVVLEDEPNTRLLVTTDMQPSEVLVESLEPSVALPLVTLRQRRACADAVLESELERAVALESGWEKTSVDTAVEPIDEALILEDAVIDDVVVEFTSAVEVRLDDEVIEHAFDDDWSNSAECNPVEDTSFEMTVIPIGAYEISYLSNTGVTLPCERSSISHFTPTVGSPTLYRDSGSVSASMRSDASVLVAQLDDGSYWDEPELCRGLRSLAGLEVTPPPQTVETRTFLPSEEPVELDVATR